MRNQRKKSVKRLSCTSLCLIGVFSALSGAGAQECIQPPAGIVSWWPADGDALDIVSGNDGALQNGATFAVGMVNQTFSLDGSDDFVLVPHSSDLNFGEGQDFTIDAWINVQTPVSGHDEEIVTKAKHAPDGFSAGYTFRVFRDSHLLMLRLTPDGFTTFDLFSNSAVALNTWTHVAAVRQGIVGRIYIDGLLDASATLSDISLANTWPLAIGGLYDTRSFPPVQRDHVFGGLLDEVEIFNRALTDQEIRSIFQAGRAGKCKTPDSDGDGVLDDLDVCSGTVISEAVPTQRLGVNRFALTDADGIFDTTPPPGNGEGPDLSFTIDDTAGCSCEQIIAALGLGAGHRKFGCSISAMEAWISLVNP